MIKITIFDNLTAKAEIQRNGKIENTQIMEQFKALQMCAEVQLKKFREKLIEEAMESSGESYEKVNADLGKAFDEYWKSMNCISIDLDALDDEVQDD